MTHLLPTFFAATFLAACTQSVVPIPDQHHPVETINPPDGTPTAFAWHNDHELIMGLDTGAIQETLLFSPTASKLGRKIRGQGPMRSAWADISLTRDGKPITAKQDVVMVDSAPYDGLIGWKTIRNYVWNINYPQECHYFYSTLPPSVKKWNSLKLVPNSDLAQIKSPSGKMIVIDTGAPHALYIAKKDWKRFKLDYPDASVSVYSGFSPAAGGFYALECMLIRSYKIGKLELKNIVACESFADKNIMNIRKDIDILLGVNAFCGREFWLDGPGGTLYFSGRKFNTRTQTNFNCAGATFIPEKSGSGTLTAKVAPWSTAWDHGLRTGDALVSLNGVKKPDQMMIDYVTCHTGAEANLIVKRKNQLLAISWTVPPLPSPGEYHPTPEALTEDAFQRHQQLLDQQAQQTQNNKPQPDTAPEKSEPATQQP